MSVIALGKVWTYKGLSSPERLVLLAYVDHADQEGRNIFPSVATIADKTELSTRTVQRSTRGLQKKGLLIPDGRGPHGVNRWRFDLEWEGVPESHGESVHDAAILKGDKNEQVVTEVEEKGDTAMSPESSLTVNRTIKESAPEETPDETMQEHFGPRPEREKRPEDDVLAGLSPDKRALALATGLAAREHERRGTRMAMTPEEEGRRLLLKFCEIHHVPVPKNKKVFARQANILLRLKNEAEAKFQDCVQALVFLKEDKTHGGFKSYNSVDEVRFQRDFRAEAFRIGQSRSQQTKSQKRAYSTTHLFTGEVTHHE